MILSGQVEYAVPAETAWAYLADPRTRPEWQSSLRSVELLDDGAPHTGMRWLDHTRVGVTPEMVIDSLDPGRAWSERGRWRFLDAHLALSFETRAPAGCLVRFRFGVRAGGLAAPLGWLLTLLGLPAVRADLRRAGRLLARGSTH